MSWTADEARECHFHEPWRAENKLASPLGIASLLAPLTPGSSNSPFCRESDKAYMLPPCRVLTCWELQKQRQTQIETHRDGRDDDDVKGQAISQRCSSQEESSPQRCSAHRLGMMQPAYGELFMQSLEEHRHDGYYCNKSTE